VNDQTAAIEVWARMLCAADAHVYGADHPTWQQTGSKIRDDYRKAAAWLLPRLTVAATPAGPAPATDRDMRERIAAAVRDAACPGDCGKTEEECAKERIQPFVWHHGKLAVVEGTPEQIADAVLPAVLPAPDQQAAAARVRALHQPMQRGPFTICAHCSGWDGKWRCLGVVTDYPCPTVRALDGEPARVAQQDPTQDGLPCGCPSEEVVGHGFGTPDCTCVPFTRQTNPPRYLNRPSDTVDMISGWERGRDCLHHRAAAPRSGQPETEARCPEAVWTPTPHPPHTWNQSPTHPQRPCPGVPEQTSQPDTD
jgi:hypothetical protein